MLANKKVFKKMYSTAREEERVRFQTKAGQADTYPPSNQQETLTHFCPSSSCGLPKKSLLNGYINSQS